MWPLKTVRDSSNAPPSESDIYDRAKKDACAEVDGVFAHHLGSLAKLRAKHPLNNSDLLSGKVTSKVASRAAEDIAQLHQKIRHLISRIAEGVSHARYHPAEEELQQSATGLNEKTRAKELLTADRAKYSSCQECNLVVEVLSHLHAGITHKLASADQQPDARQQRWLLLSNAVLVYEIADFTIGFLNEFLIRGTEQIETVYKEFNRKKSKDLAEVQQLRQQAAGKGVDPGVREKTLESIRYREEALDFVTAEWEQYLEENGRLQQEVAELRKHLPNLELIRANAKNQIDVLETISLLPTVKEGVSALRDAIGSVEKMKLIPLSTDRVKKLLGLR